jgi:hypothetical protein
MAETFIGAPLSVLHCAQALIRQYHLALEPARIAFVMRSEELRTNGTLVIARTTRVPEAMATIGAEYDFLTWIDLRTWDMATETRRQAIIDHELCHMALSSTGTWTIRPHDIGEFKDILDRYGAWNRDLQHYLGAVMLPGLPGIGSSGSVATLTGEQLEKAVAAI